MLAEKDCYICKGAGGWSEKHMTELGEYDFWFTCSCVDRAKSMHRIKKSGLSGQIERFRFENFITEHDFQKNIFMLAGRFLATGLNRWFVALGKTGAGKTHICTAICGKLLEKGLSVAYVRWAVELKKLKMSAGKEEYWEILDDLLVNDVIYIDDLFKRGKGAMPTDADVRIAFEIIDTAAAQGKMLIISGEDMLETLIDIDEAIAGRIKQKAGEFLVQIKGEGKNYRLMEEFL